MYFSRIFLPVLIFLIIPVNYYTNPFLFNAKGVRISVSDKNLKPSIQTASSFKTTSLAKNQMERERLFHNKIGIHITKEELAIWRERAKKGPYKTKGDVSENSPGDWDRIIRNANKFLLDPYKEIWKGDPSKGCVQKYSAHPSTEGVKLRDAAFVYLIKKENIYLNAVKKNLLAQANEPLTDFSNHNRWCEDVLYDVNPAFSIAEWLTRLLLAYDYTKDGFDNEEKVVIERWFKDAAYFFYRNTNPGLNKLFVDREKNDHRLSSYAMAVKVNKLTAVSSEDGWQIPSLAKSYNNRRAVMMRFVAFTGILINDDKLKNSAKVFVKEWLKFSVFPDGVVGEFERWKENFPDLGWAYASSVISANLDIADALARDGDFELYNFSTSEGYFGTEGGNKSLLLTARTLVNFLDGTVKKHIPIPAGKDLKFDPYIDGIIVEKNWFTVNDIWLSVSNVYFHDEYLKNNYLRKSQKRLPYPPADKLATTGPHQPWSGVGAIYPGILFMFGKMDGIVWPYPIEKDEVKAGLNK